MRSPSSPAIAYFSLLVNLLIPRQLPVMRGKEMTVDLHSRMMREFKDKAPLNAAHSHAINFIDGALDRRVYPGPAEIAELDRFVEDLPDEGIDGRKVIDQLSRYGGPATVASVGGRYFGLVVGGLLPAALGAR